MFSAALFVLIDCQFARCPHLSGDGRYASERASGKASERVSERTSERVPIKARSVRCKETSRSAVRDRIFDWSLSSCPLTISRAKVPTRTT